MKKFGLLTLGLLYSSTASAVSVYNQDKISLNIDGNLAGYTVYNSTASSKKNQNKLDISGYGEVHINAEVEKDSNTRFGAYIELETNPYDSDSKTYEETYVYGETFLGRFEIGRAKNITRKLQITTPDVGILDIDGSWGLDYILTPNNFRYIGSTAINTDCETNKFNYISPSLAGLQIAGSYTPGTTNLNGDNTIEYDKFKNGWTSSLKYTYSNIDDFALTLGYGKFNDINLNGITANLREEFSVGAKYYTKGIQFTASYRNIKEDDVTNTNTLNGYALNYGIAYEIGPFAISLANHKSSVNDLIGNSDRDVLNLSLLSTKYNIAKGVDFALSVGRIDLKEENNVSSVGGLVTTGFMVNF